MPTRLVAHRPHATLRWNHLAQVGQVGGGAGLTRYVEILVRLRQNWRQDLPLRPETAKCPGSLGTLPARGSEFCFRYMSVALYSASGASKVGKLAGEC